MASGNAQGVWLEAVEERVAVTSKVLGGMKSIKMTGLTDIISDIVRKLRSQEIEASFIYRLYTVLVTTFCSSLPILSRLELADTSQRMLLLLWLRYSGLVFMLFWLMRAMVKH